MEFGNRHEDRPFYIHRTSVFDRSLDDLRKKKGTASMSAGKVDEIIRHLTQEGPSSRGKYRLTWNGEHRIKNCRKIDLVGGYRLVCIQKDCYVVLLYVGSHDECFRWIERNKGLTYDVDHANSAARMRHSGQQGDPLPEEYFWEKRFVEEYEKNLMHRIDDKALKKIFFGLCNTE